MYVFLAAAVIHSTINNHFDFCPFVNQIDFLNIQVDVWYV